LRFLFGGIFPRRTIIAIAGILQQLLIVASSTRRHGILTKEFIPWICGTND